jgi:hypothetical protein
MTTIINGSSPSITFSDSTTQATAAPYGPAFSAYNSATQAISSATATKVVFDTKEYDTNSNFASSRFTPTVAGYYSCFSSCAIPSASNAGEAQIYFKKNNTIYYYGQDIQATHAYTILANSLIYLNGSTDYIEVFMYLGTGGTLQATLQYFQAVMVRSA